MVGTNPERRDLPEYSLSRIHQLAEWDAISVPFRRTQEDLAELGYGQEDVRECLARLQADDFRHSERYDDLPLWHDVYKFHWLDSNGKPVPLYIKLRLSSYQNRHSGVDLVLICSFHVALYP